MSQYDIAIIGAGAAGLSAALVLSRARRAVVVIDAGAPRNAPAAHMHGYLSRDGLPPGELLAYGRKEVQHYGGEIVDDTVTDIASDGWGGFRADGFRADGFRAGDFRADGFRAGGFRVGGFRVSLAGGEQVSARRLLITTGLRDELPDVPGLRERWARDVLHCPYCHGYEVRDQRLGVLGGTASAVRYAHIVRQWSDDLVYFTAPDTLTRLERTELAARGVAVVEGAVAQLVIDDDRLRGVQMHDGCVVPLDALFVPPRLVPNSHLLTSLGCDVDDDGWVTADAAGRTSVAGVWAAGNVIDPRAQVISAAGAGSAAAIALNADLVDEDVRTAVRPEHVRPEHVRS